MTKIFIFSYEHKKKISECNVINSADLLYLRIINTNGQFEKGKDDAWYLVEYDKDYMKIKFECNNIFPIDKDVNIFTATIIIRAIFAKDGNYYPQLFLDHGLYKNVSV